MCNISDGQSVAKRVKLQLQRIGRHIRTSVATYNSLAEVSSSVTSLPNNIMFKDVVVDAWPVWQIVLAVESANIEGAPAGLRRFATDIYAVYQRAEEEKTNVYTDMACMCTHLIRQYYSIIEIITKFRGDSTAFGFGAMALLLRKAIALEMELMCCMESFKDYVDFSDVKLSGFVAHYDILVSNSDVVSVEAHSRDEDLDDGGIGNGDELDDPEASDSSCDGSDIDDNMDVEDNPEVVVNCHQNDARNTADVPTS